MYFKWVTCLLLRQFTMKICLRLYDTYLSSENTYFSLCLFIFASIVLKYSKKFKSMRFEELMILLQNMPTKEWSEEDLATIIAEAYVYQSYFKWYCSLFNWGKCIIMNLDILINHFFFSIFCISFRAITSFLSIFLNSSILSSWSKILLSHFWCS